MDGWMSGRERTPGGGRWAETEHIQGSACVQEVGNRSTWCRDEGMRRKRVLWKKEGCWWLSPPKDIQQMFDNNHIYRLIFYYSELMLNLCPVQYTHTHRRKFSRHSNKVGHTDDSDEKNTLVLASSVSL